jgi:hypothetical protein
MTIGRAAITRISAGSAALAAIELRKKLLAKITQIVWLFRAAFGIFVQRGLSRAKPIAAIRA